MVIATIQQEVILEVQPPLVVDLDGTLIKTDLLVESLLALLKQNPLYLFVIPWWLLHGRAHLKQQIAQRVTVDVTVLPYHSTFLAYLKKQRAQGRRLILATASNERFAHQVAGHLQIFAEVLASNETLNLKGEHKRACLVARFGVGGFDYAGGDNADIEVWRSARKAIVVNPEYGIKAAAAQVATVDQVFEDRQGGLNSYLRALRIHQWLKNLLVFVPLLAAHQFHEGQLLFQAVLAFLAFSLCASSAYVLNDLLDLPADRYHPRKRHRPFTSGELSVLHGVMLIPLLLGLAFILALFLPLTFIGMLVLYYALTLAYSFQLKRVVLLDVLVLASLYTVRIIAGSAAVAIWPSFWLLAFSMFLFLSLAMVKRYTELLSLRNEGEQNAKGRGYQVGDLALLTSLGGASGYMAVLVLALYINSETVTVLYSNSEVIWLLCPLLLYWISRVWLIAHRGNMHDDPIVFALEDRVSRLIVLSMAVILILAI